MICMEYLSWMKNRNDEGMKMRFYCVHYYVDDGLWAYMRETRADV